MGIWLSAIVDKSSVNNPYEASAQIGQFGKTVPYEASRGRQGAPVNVSKTGQVGSRSVVQESKDTRPVCLFWLFC